MRNALDSLSSITKKGNKKSSTHSLELATSSRHLRSLSKRSLCRISPYLELYFLFFSAFLFLVQIFFFSEQKIEEGEKENRITRKEKDEGNEDYAVTTISCSSPWGFTAERRRVSRTSWGWVLHNQDAQLCILWGDLTGSIKSRVAQACVMMGRQLRK